MSQDLNLSWLMRLNRKEVILMATQLWTAFDLTTLSTNVAAGLGVGVVIIVGYAAYKHINRLGKKV